MISPEKVHTSNIVRTKQIGFNYLGIYVTAIKEKEATDLKESREVHGRGWKEEIM